MKKSLKLFLILLICFTALILVSCEDSITVAGADGNGAGGTNDDGNGYDIDLGIFVVDISQYTDWNYMVVGRDGSSIFINVDEDSGTPTRLFIKADRNYDIGFTILLKENGLPNKMIAQNYILYFGNFRGYQFDMAIICPNNTIEYFFDIQTHTNWDAYNEISIQERFIILGRLRRTLNIVSHVVGISTCVVTPFFPPAAGKCATYVARQVGNIVAPQVFDRFTVESGNAFMDIFACAAGGWTSPVDCLKAISSTASVLSNLDFNLVVQRTVEINEAIRRIDGDGLTVIPPDLLEDLLRLGIEINHGNNPPCIEGTFFVSPQVLVRSNFTDSSSPGHLFADMELTFSNQNNARMTVDVDFIYHSILADGTGANSFITGSGNNFSVFSDTSGTTRGGFPFRSVEIYSGKISPSGIMNFQRVLIITMEAPDTIRRGQGRLFRDEDGFSERISTVHVQSLNLVQRKMVASSETLLPSVYSE